ncbi:MAG TPA: hypothetical protein VMG08_17925 [Allosphingosinicella sp.]|nr:hypothetical protein [Allosphingosinicella sp.]
MTAARFGAIQKFLLGFVPAGLLLIAASWLVTGAAPAAWTLAPFALLFVAWLGLRASVTEGNKNAR